MGNAKSKRKTLAEPEPTVQPNEAAHTDSAHASLQISPPMQAEGMARSSGAGARETAGCQILGGPNPCDGTCASLFLPSRNGARRSCIDAYGVILPRSASKPHSLVHADLNEHLQQQLQVYATELNQVSQQLEAEREQRQQAMEERRSELQQALSDWQFKQRLFEQQVQRLTSAQQAPSCCRVSQGLLLLSAMTSCHITWHHARSTVPKSCPLDVVQGKQFITRNFCLSPAQAQAADLQQELAREREEMEMMEERLSTANAAEEDMLADMRAIKEQLASAQSQLALTTSTNAGHDYGRGRGQAQPQPPALRGSGGSSFPMGFGCVEQRECLDQLSVAVEQLAAVLTQGSSMGHPIVQRLLQAAKEEAGVSAAGAEVGYDLGISSWDSNAASAALHSHVLTLTLRTVQQLPWLPPSPFDTCLASCPEAGRTDLQAAMQQLQQAKSSTLRPLFLVRPGLVCPAAGGGRQVLVRQQLVELVPDPVWQEQQRQQAAEEARERELQQRFSHCGQYASQPYVSPSIAYAAESQVSVQDYDQLGIGRSQRFSQPGFLPVPLTSLAEDAACLEAVEAVLPSQAPYVSEVAACTAGHAVAAPQATAAATTANQAESADQSTAGSSSTSGNDDWHSLSRSDSRSDSPSTAIDTTSTKAEEMVHSAQQQWVEGRLHDAATKSPPNGVLTVEGAAGPAATSPPAAAPATQAAVVPPAGLAHLFTAGRVAAATAVTLALGLVSVLAGSPQVTESGHMPGSPLTGHAGPTPPLAPTSPLPASIGGVSAPPAEDRGTHTDCPAASLPGPSPADLTSSAAASLPGPPGSPAGITSQAADSHLATSVAAPTAAAADPMADLPGSVAPLLTLTLTKLTQAVQQLAVTLASQQCRQHPLVKRLLQAAKQVVGDALPRLSWEDEQTCSDALHDQILTLALQAMQPEDQEDLAHTARLALSQQQTASSLHAEGVQEHTRVMVKRLQQQLGLEGDPDACSYVMPQLLAVAAAMARVNLLVTGLQGGCPGLQLVSSLEDWAAPEGQRACEAPPAPVPGAPRPGLPCCWRRAPGAGQAAVGGAGTSPHMAQVTRGDGGDSEEEGHEGPTAAGGSSLAPENGERQGLD
ncbi:hypothetical protein HaLaN_00534 [Haematococcus lacustris]|uniref:Uncharacterized protein n=1 Tax=Haematococcus lacustris TaxID=44745 RepID=A0A699Y6Y8_HAELA|nr:hypothetical protein HaLaN_00534 [Haematococcus lacustris]